MSPDLFDTIFRVFFGGISLFILWGFVRVFLWERVPPSRRSVPPLRGRTPHRAGRGSYAESVTTLGILGSSESSAAVSMDTGGSDSGGDSGTDSGGDSGGGDFSGGGGDSGGGGSSGGW